MVDTTGIYIFIERRLIFWRTLMEANVKLYVNNLYRVERLKVFVVNL